MSPTPGPWDATDGTCISAPAEDWPYTQDVCIFAVDCEPTLEDANLIAAAPTMYEFLERKAKEGDHEAEAIIASL